MHHWGCKPLQERGMCGQSGGEHQVRLHLHFTAKAAAAAVAEAQKPKKQAVWVRMHLQGHRGRGRGRGLETLENSETTTEEEGGEARVTPQVEVRSLKARLRL